MSTVQKINFYPQFEEVEEKPLRWPFVLKMMFLYFLHSSHK